MAISKKIDKEKCALIIFEAALVAASIHNPLLPSKLEGIDSKIKRLQKLQKDYFESKCDDFDEFENPWRFPVFQEIEGFKPRVVTKPKERSVLPEDNTPETDSPYLWPALVGASLGVITLIVAKNPRAAVAVGTLGAAGTAAATEDSKPAAIPSPGSALFGILFRN
jgi:hypothetical protein